MAPRLAELLSYVGFAVVSVSWGDGSGTGPAKADPTEMHFAA